MSDNQVNSMNITLHGDRSVAVVAQSGSTVNLQYHQTYSDLSTAFFEFLFISVSKTCASYGCECRNEKYIINSFINRLMVYGL